MGEKNIAYEIKCLLQCQTEISSNTNGYNILAHALTESIIYLKNTEREKKKQEDY